MLPFACCQSGYKKYSDDPLLGSIRWLNDYPILRHLVRKHGVRAFKAFEGIPWIKFIMRFCHEIECVLLDWHACERYEFSNVFVVVVIPTMISEWRLLQGETLRI